MLPAGAPCSWRQAIRRPRQRPPTPPPARGPGPTAALSPPPPAGHFCLRRPDFSPRWMLSHLYSFNWNVSACLFLHMEIDFSLLFVAYIAFLLQHFLGVLGIFPQMARLRPERRQFNEFVTNGAETAAGPVPIQKFLANLRPTHRKHGMAKRQGSPLAKAINKGGYQIRQIYGQHKD